MILALLLSALTAAAQSPFCQQLPEPDSTRPLRTNVKVRALSAVADQALGITSMIRNGVKREISFATLRTEAAGKGISLNDQSHLDAYLSAARTHCEGERTEGMSGPVSTEAFVNRTHEGDTRHLNNMDIPGDSPTNSTSESGSEATD